MVILSALFCIQGKVGLCLTLHVIQRKDSLSPKTKPAGFSWEYSCIPWVHYFFIDEMFLRLLASR